MIDKQGKLFGKINILDLFVVTLILLLAVGTYYKLTSEKLEMSTGEHNIEYVLKIRNVSDFTSEYYTEGTEVFDRSTNEMIGVITNVLTEPTKDVINTKNGDLSLTEVPGKLDIYITLEGKGIETEKSYLINGVFELKRGSTVKLKTKYLEVDSVVYDILTD